MALLSTERVTMRFGGLTAVCDLGVRIEKDEIVGLIGPNGAGKTTAFNVITGMNAPTAVESAAEAAEVHGLGNRCWERPNSLCAIAWTICSGDSASRSAMRCDSSGANPWS